MGLRIAAEGAVRENIFDNEEPGRGVGRLARRGAAPGGTVRSCVLASVCTCVRSYVRACVRARMRACVRTHDKHHSDIINTIT